MKRQILFILLAISLIVGCAGNRTTVITDDQLQVAEAIISGRNIENDIEVNKFYSKLQNHEERLGFTLALAANKKVSNDFVLMLIQHQRFEPRELSMLIMEFRLHRTMDQTPLN